MLQQRSARASSVGETMADLLDLARKKEKGRMRAPPHPPSLPFSSKCWLPPRGVGSQHFEKKGREGGGKAASLCHRMLQ